MDRTMLGSSSELMKVLEVRQAVLGRHVEQQLRAFSLSTESLW